MKLSPRIRTSKTSQPPPTNQPPKLTNPIQEELKNIKDALNSVAEFQSSAVEALEVYWDFFKHFFTFIRRKRL